MGRLDTSRHRPPVRIGLANAAIQQGQMTRHAPRLARGAGNFGQREVRFASVPLRLRIQSKAGPNTEMARRAVLPMGITYRKRGYPPLVDLPTAKG